MHRASLEFIYILSKFCVWWLTETKRRAVLLMSPRFRSQSIRACRRWWRWRYRGQVPQCRRTTGPIRERSDIGRNRRCVQLFPRVCLRDCPSAASRNWSCFRSTHKMLASLWNHRRFNLRPKHTYIRLLSSTGNNRRNNCSSLAPECRLLAANGTCQENAVQSP